MTGVVAIVSEAFAARRLHTGGPCVDERQEPQPGIHRLSDEESCSEDVGSDAETVVLVARREEGQTDEVGRRTRSRPKRDLLLRSTYGPDEQTEDNVIPGNAF